MEKNQIKINKKKYYTKPYPHFDSRIPFNKKVIKYLSNSDNISSHSFYPFIHYTKKTRKYSKKNRTSTEKTREIYYASHFDGYVLKYYGELLNDKYNKYCRQNGIDEVSIAYRNNKHGKNNVHFASEVIRTISELDQAFIFVSDFTSYFDNLDHILLKERLLRVLGENSNELSRDWWTIYKNITRFSWVEKTDIEEYILKTKGVNLKKISKDQVDRYFSPDEFREFRKVIGIKKNKTIKGIPQGSPISAVLANVYAIDLDYELNQYALQFGGLYRRYSDDIILVFPLEELKDYKIEKLIEFITSIVEQNKIEMGTGKTNSLFYINNRIYSDSFLKKKGKLDYLGFVFDGENVKIREKSLYKYYHRMYKKIDSIRRAEAKKGRKVGRKKLYQLYSHLGRKYKGYGNFYSYAEKGHTIFNKIDNIESQIYKQVKKHWNKIHKRLK
ncbi:MULTISPECIES: reverse transcriptase domain-containing protein [Bacillaceae]|uniref:reverse transcriptase domain-containing protein n=1 Tax=Bacillaceae TaxID=186817 RepID=UPI00203C6F7F|nr:reverse transcriptase domain-containing protein [Caldibacillus thermoamylovorans]MCM3478580.1 reverse transcriptase domain-containing protein [Caldibacillus thermoamylovorans]